MTYSFNPFTGTLDKVSETAPGPGGSSAYIHNQTTPSASWTVTHGLNRYAGVTIYVSGEVVLADVAYTDPNSVTVVLAQPTSGVAVVN